MNLERLAKQGRAEIYTNLAGRRDKKLYQMQNKAMMDCFVELYDTQHRIETVAKIRGIEFVNDSFSRTPNSTWYALESMYKPVIWITESPSQMLNYTDLISMVYGKVKNIICVGEDNKQLMRTFTGLVDSIFEVKTIEDATIKAFSLAEPEEIVLFSPATTSDLSYQERGTVFCAAVNEL